MGNVTAECESFQLALNPVCFDLCGNEENMLMKNAYESLGLSARANSRILKVARTIADIEGKEILEKSHIIQASQFRTLDRKYWQNN